MIIDMAEARVRLDRLHEAQARAAQFRDTEIRGWAVSKGYIHNWDLSGEIPESIVQEFDSSHLVRPDSAPLTCGYIALRPNLSTSDAGPTHRYRAVLLTALSAHPAPSMTSSTAPSPWVYRP